MRFRYMYIRYGRKCLKVSEMSACSLLNFNLLCVSRLLQKVSEMSACSLNFNLLCVSLLLPGCYKITTVFSHAQTVVLCVSCSTVLCQPTGGRARLTEGSCVPTLSPSCPPPMIWLINRTEIILRLTLFGVATSFKSHEICRISTSFVLLHFAFILLM